MRNVKQVRDFIDKYSTDKNTDKKEVRRQVSKILSRFYSIKQRCNNPNNKRYNSYGARGIKVCDEWLENSLSFVKWCFENGFDENLTIDRKNNNEGYYPENCRFITFLENSGNTQQCVPIDIVYEIQEGKYKDTSFRELKNILGHSVSTLHRIKHKDYGEKMIIFKESRNY